MNRRRRLLAAALTAATSGTLMVVGAAPANAWLTDKTATVSGQVTCVDIFRGTGKVLWLHVSSAPIDGLPQQGGFRTTSGEPATNKAYSQKFTLPGRGKHLKVTATWACGDPQGNKVINPHVHRTSFDLGRKTFGSSSMRIDLRPNDTSEI